MRETYWRGGEEKMPETTDSERMMTVEETATMLGLSRASLYNRRYAGSDLPPSYRVGDRVRYRRRDVEQWLETRREAPRTAAHV